METRRTKVATIGWLVAALWLIPLVPVSGAQAQKYASYRVDAKGLTAPEQYVLAQTEKGEIADLLEQIPDKAIREQVGKLGLTGYVQQLKEEDREGFLNKYGNRLRLRAKFIETLLTETEGFPGFKIHRHGVRIANALIKEPLDLEFGEVEHEVWLVDSILQGEANFRDSYFKQNLVLSGVQFLGKADFERVKVGKNLFLREARFDKQVVIRRADVGVDIDAGGAQLLNAKAEASFSGMKVGQEALFKKAEFQGPANFNSMKVGQSASFAEATFQGPVDFVMAQIGGQFIAVGAQFFNKEQKATLNSMQVGGMAFFDGATFQGPVDLGYSSFQGLRFRDVNYAKVRLEGMTYRNIIFGDNWKILLTLLKNSSPYHAQPYSQMATFFQQSGYPDRADEVFIAGKRRELDPSWRHPSTWTIYIFWDLLAGYGRAPFRSFGVGLLFVIFGAIFIFNPRHLKLEALKQWNLDYDLKLRDFLRNRRIFKDTHYIKNLLKISFLRFMVSFDQFIPAINLGLAPHWEPEALSFTKWFFAYLLRISGWILIPIGLAAIASQFK